MATDPRTQAYVARRAREGKTTREIIRCLMRYVAREAYKALTAHARQPNQGSARHFYSMIT
jgi:transposase